MTTMIKKSLGIMAVLAVLTGGFLSSATDARALNNEELFGGEKANIASGLNVSATPKTPQQIAANVIKILLGFLGIIAVIIIIVAGFQWMTAGGDSAKVDGAKKRLQAAVIGLVIILAAWGLANFVINQLITATQ